METDQATRNARIVEDIIKWAKKSNPGSGDWFSGYVAAQEVVWDIIEEHGGFADAKSLDGE